MDTRVLGIKEGGALPPPLGVCAAGAAAKPDGARRRWLRVVPLLALAAGAAVAAVGYGASVGSDVKLHIGKPFVMGIIALFDLKVDQITLRDTKKWPDPKVNLVAFDLLMDVHMDLLFFGAQAPRPSLPEGAAGPLSHPITTRPADWLQATLGSAEFNLAFGGERFGTLHSLPCPLGGGGKIKTKIAGTLVVDDLAVFRKVARAVVTEDELHVELYTILAVELRGADHGICRTDVQTCKTKGTLRIPDVPFAKSVVLRGARSFGIEFRDMLVLDQNSTEPAGDALITIDVRVNNPSSFVMRDLGAVQVDVYTDKSGCARKEFKGPREGKSAAKECLQRLATHDTDARPTPEHSLGVKFAEVQTETDFWLARSPDNDWFRVKGKLAVPPREHDLVSTADVFNHFLTSRDTPLIARVAAVPSHPFYEAAATGLALRVGLPGMGPGDHDIIQKVYIDLNIPVATVTLLNPFNGGSLEQYMHIALRNPLDAELYVHGLAARILYNDVHVGTVSLPELNEHEAIVLPPSATFVTARQYPVLLHAANVADLLKLLKQISPPPVGEGSAMINLDARIAARVGGVEPTLVYRQSNVTCLLESSLLGVKLHENFVAEESGNDSSSDYLEEGASS